MKKSYKIFAAVATVLLVAGCVLVPRVKTGAFEQKADQKQNAAAKAEDAHADLTENSPSGMKVEIGTSKDDMDIYDYEDTESSTTAPTGKEYDAYLAFLEQYEGDGEEAYSRVAGQYGSKMEVHYFSILDLNRDGTDDLLTYEIVNMRYEKIRAYTLDDKDNVVPFQFEDGQEALFDNNHQANGAYGFYVCSEGHIHNCYSGGFSSNEMIYRVEGNTILLYLTHEEDYEKNSSTYFEQGTKIGRSKYEALTEKCGEDQFSWILNNAEGRKSLGNG